MDKYDNRRLRLQQIIDAQFAGSRAAFASRVDRQADYISRCLSTKQHRKRIGEDFAAHIETTLGLQPGWFDRVIDGTAATISVDVTIREELILELLRSLTPEQQEVLLSEIRHTREANLVTQRMMGDQLKKTIGNAEMEHIYGLPKPKNTASTVAAEPRGPTYSPRRKGK